MSEQTLDVSVIIPFKDKSQMTMAAVNSLLKFGPSASEILLVSNNSSEEELQKVRQAVQSLANIRILEYNKPFNYQKLNNWAAARSKANFILFLNNDTELTEKGSGLIEEMYKRARRPDVGAVGCLLLYGDERTIQHAGVFLVPGGLGDHVYVGKNYHSALKKSGSGNEFPYKLDEDRPLTAVTGAVCLVEKTKFSKINGFDERFIVCGGDVDLCIRLNQAGFQTWFVAAGGKYIIHKESQSRTFKPVPFNDFYYSYLAYSTAYDLVKGDPFVPKISEFHGVNP